MKTCMIYGDMSSDRSSENYPTVIICDECVEGMGAGEEDSAIVSVGKYDPSLGDTCENCGKTKSDEDKER